MRVKICGITQVEQGRAVADLGADSIGFICVSQSPRYVAPAQIKAIAEHLPESTTKVGVFANHSLAEIASTVERSSLSSVQLHGAESPEFCQQLHQKIDPGIEIIKAFRIKSKESLQEANAYAEYVNTLLLDAYHPNMLGGTGHTIDWQDLAQFKPSLPWMLAGGLTPDNIKGALSRLQPNGIDLSSGVERSPGDKDLAKVRLLFEALKN